MNSHIEDMNYYSDHRVKALRRSCWYQDLDENRMEALIEDMDTGDDLWVPFTWGVCPTCNGKGSHVNPSIDCCGVRPETFNEDPDFREAYLAGHYNVPCYGCEGKRVVPESDDPRVMAIQKFRNDCEAEYAAERRMGA